MRLRGRQHGDLCVYPTHCASPIYSLPATRYSLLPPMTMLQHTILVLLLPLASAAVIGLFLRRAGGVAAAISTVTAAAIAIIAVILALHRERFDSAMEWLRLGSFSLSLGVKFDDLASLMLCIVGVVGLCVHVFSLGYMREDGTRARYFGGLSIFMFSM